MGFTRTAAVTSPIDEQARWWRRAVSAVGVAALMLFACCTLAHGQNYPVVEWINQSGGNAVTSLNGSGSFVTDFKGTDDVMVSLLTGSVNSIYQENFGGPTPGNNPSYVTDFVGSPLNGTGNGVPGVILTLETGFDAERTSLQFDFAQPLTPADRFLIADIDNNEQYQIEAFVQNELVYQSVDLTGWTHESLTGQTGVLPDSRWAIWYPQIGLLDSNAGGNINEPLDALTPDQDIDRITITELRGGGTVVVQFISVPEPTAWVTALLAFSGFLTIPRRMRE
jgi:hypothetical protein